MSRTHAAVITYRNQEGCDLVCSGLTAQDTAPVIHIRDNSDDNIYYTAGINHVIKTALNSGAEFVLLCTDDIRFIQKETVSLLISYLRENEDCGIAMPLHLGKEGKVTFAGGEKCFPYGHNLIPPLDHDMLKAPYEIAWGNTSCALVRAEVFQECGLLDENMRFLCSDSDFCLTARARGWRIFLVPEARIQHDYGMANSKTGLNELTRIKNEDFLYFMRKWIIGGLFQELAVEGKTLTMELIHQRLHEIESTLNHIAATSQGIGSHNSHAPGIQLT